MDLIDRIVNCDNALILASAILVIVFMLCMTKLHIEHSRWLRYERNRLDKAKITPPTKIERDYTNGTRT